ncbi:major facilitator superfamily domain-containing protein 6 isoform X2 [Trichogramma pretiosum]|uniref:major facilitator superfamily domain-containing protein 6 isoform X2 n=1 Tax=Trichogramma pretiosum TaxID=7493 RepID=UPI0006C9CE7D|nr:major facilitator superfamily domain-containing protein 6 isoform X2 [Trichogramma pretiosum]
MQYYESGSMAESQNMDENNANNYNLPTSSAARPMVDPHAEGNVDINLYPQPKEATHKIRGKNDFIEYLFGAVDQELLTVKTFYFFFYSAFGSLFPLMGVYFKQMGMNAGQCGLLIGIRPFIEFLSAPFWGSWADRWKRGKLILLASLSCWVIFTLPLGFVQPPATSCMIYKNHTYLISIPDADQKISKRSIQKRSEFSLSEKEMETEKYLPNQNNMRDELMKNSSFRYNLIGNFEINNSSEKIQSYDGQDNEKQRNTMKMDPEQKKEDNFHKTHDQQSLFDDETSKDTKGSNKNIHRKTRSIKLQFYSNGQSPMSVRYAANYDEKVHKGWVKPIFSSIVYKLPDIQKTFFLLLLLVIVGEFFSAPAITLADSAVITLLGEDTDRYGHQRMFGSLGWGLAMFFVGIALDHSTSFPEHPCVPDLKERNYTICFAIFSVLMGAALITATQINFKYDPAVPQVEVVTNLKEPSREEQLQNDLSQQLNLPHLQDFDGKESDTRTQPFEEKTKIFAQTTREIPEWLTILKQFKNLKCASFLFVAWFMGFGIGLIFTFLFWHLQDYGGTPTLFGVASVINHVSEIFAYFFSFKLIRQLGHVKVLCLGLCGNIFRFLYISWLKNPWWVLPFEFVQGITHAAVWAACCSYIAHNTPPPLRSSAQGVLQGLHHGLGRGCGAVIGGIFVAVYGTTATFRAYGLLCMVVLAVFIFINFYRQDAGFIANLPQTEDPHQVAEVTHLAPHGVPSNAIPRALSSSRLHELSNQDGSYGATYQASLGHALDVPGKSEGLPNPNNPFLSKDGLSYKNMDISNELDGFIQKSFQTFNEVVNMEMDIKRVPSMVIQLEGQQQCTNPFHEHNYEW